MYSKTKEAGFGEIFLKKNVSFLLKDNSKVLDSSSRDLESKALVLKKSG